MIESLYEWRGVLFALVIVAAIIDIRSFTIPNVLPVLAIGLLPVILLAVGAPGSDYKAAALAGLVGLAIGYALFALGVMGGGDGKLFAAVAAWFGLGAMINLGFWIALCGVFVSLISLLIQTASRRSMQGAAKGGSSSIMRTPVPYGVAIAAGVIIAAQAPLAI